MAASLCESIRGSISHYYYHECDLNEAHGEHWVTRTEFIATSAVSIMFIVIEIANLLLCGIPLEDGRTWSGKLHDMAIEIIAMPLGLVGMCFPQTVNAYVLGSNLSAPA